MPNYIAPLPLQHELTFDSQPQLVDIQGFDPFFEAKYGRAYLANSLELMKAIPSNSINLVVTSPPYALHFKKEYGNVTKTEYVEWFLVFAREIQRILTDDGSFVLNIGGSFNKGEPTRSLYHYKLLIELVDTLGFKLAQELFWYNPAKMPVPAEWVTVRRIRVKDSVENVFWLSKTTAPKASNRRVLRPYGEDMLRLNKKGLSKTQRPSGHNINESFTKVDAGGSIPPNVIEEEFVEESFVDSMMRFGNNSANDQYTKKCKENGIKIHPARFPAALPEFFIKLLTEEGDIVLDPFAGSNTTGAVAERLNRRWISAELEMNYLEASKFRFA